MQLDLIQSVHLSTKRDYLERMTGEKPHHVDIALQFERDYWDGSRLHGYGGYKYDGRWKPFAEKMIRQFNLTENSSLIDLGCGKAHLLTELKRLLPGLRVLGLDNSSYALETAPAEIQPFLQKFDLRQGPWPFQDRQFDLAISLNTLHNLRVDRLFPAFQEFERIARQKYVVLDSYRNPRELMNLQCWTLTCASFYSNEDWKWIFKTTGYSGFYEFIHFE